MTKKIELDKSNSLIDYQVATRYMESRADSIHKGDENELIWLLEHPPIYTAGSSAKKEELLIESEIPVYQTPRGGKFTYHGPGQRIIYVMLDLRRFNKDIRLFIETLEDILINTMDAFGIEVYPKRERIGLWIKKNKEEEKIGAIGLKVKKWISLHGIAININPDMQYFDGIIPCGISDFGVTCLNNIDPNITLNRFDKKFLENFELKIEKLITIDNLILSERI